MTDQEYTPTKNEVRERYAAARYYLDNEDHLTESGREFDRWLAEHDRQVAERAWQKGAQHVYEDGGKCSFARDGDPCPYNPYRKEATGV